MNLIGQKAPDFKLNDEQGLIHELKDYKGKYLVLYFYPKDMTSGCTIEAQSFRNSIDEFKKRGVEVIGVSADDESKHKKFIEKEGLNFSLLADVDKKTCKDYGVWVEKSMYGRKYMGIQRDTFLIDPEGVVIKHYKKVKPKDHVENLIEDLDKIIQ